MGDARYQIPSITSGNGRSDALNQRPAHGRVLLVEPDPTMLMVEALLFTRGNYRVTTACSHWQIFDFRHIDSLTVAVLSDALGAPALKRSAHAVRKQWPRARILIVGRAASVLDDNLYEEDTPHSADPRMLLIAIQELAKDIRGSMWADPEFSQNVATVALSVLGPPGEFVRDLAKLPEKGLAENAAVASTLNA